MKLWKIMAVLCLASPLGAQVQIGKGVQVGGNGSGATLPTNAITYGTSSTTSRAVTTTDVSNLLQSSSGCTVAGQVYSPQSNTCITGGGGSPVGPSNALQTNAGSGLFGNSGCTAISGAISCPGTGGTGFLGLGQGAAHSVIANTLGLQVPTLVTGYNFTFPGAQGTGCLTNDGSGIGSWAACGGLSGQTINFLPLATSSTASTISSHFFESGGMSGVNNTFTMNAAAPNCIAVGAGFTQFACIHMGMTDDGSSANHNLFGFSMGLNAWGPGGGYKLGDTVGFENRGNTLFGGTNMTALVTAGQKSGYYNNLSAYGLGDAQPGFNFVNNCQTGLGYSSDEGCSNRLRLGETIGEWSSTITSGTNTQPLFTAGGGQCQGYENQSCAPAPGTVMIDTSVVRASGHVTSAPSSGALGLSWLSQSTTDFAPPTSTAWGFHTAINYTPSASTTWDAPVSATFLIGGGAGTFAAGDHACMIGANFTEQNIISAVSGTAPNQTITMPLVMPETDIAIFKGDCMYMDLDADAAQGVHYALAAVSVDGTNIVYTYPSHGLNLPSPIPVDGTTFSLFGADPTRSGVHLYAGARITKVGTANPGGPFPFTVPDIRVFLAPNSAFSVGDVLLNPHFAAQGVTGLDMITEQNQAPTSSGQPTGVSSSLVGKAISTFARAYFGVNANSSSLYKQYGGLLNEPRFIFQQGLFDSFAQADTTPLTSIFHFNAHQTGQTSYFVLSDPTWGDLTIDNTLTLSFTNDFHAGGSISSNGIVSGLVGLKSGVGDGGGAFAGVEFPFRTETSTWLAQCSVYPFSTGNPTDLCVTSQGASRSSYAVTADRGIQASSLNLKRAGVSLGGGFVLYDDGTFKDNIQLQPSSFQFLMDDSAATKIIFGHANYARTVITTDATIDQSGTVTATIFGWSTDTGLSRGSAGVVDVGNGTAGNASGAINAATYGAGTLANGMIATTQPPGANNTAVATTAYADAVAGTLNLGWAGSGTLSAGACSTTTALTIPGASANSALTASWNADTSAHLATTAGISLTVGYDQSTNTEALSVCNTTTGTWTIPTGLTMVLGRIH